MILIVFGHSKSGRRCTVAAPPFGRTTGVNGSLPNRPLWDLCAPTSVNSVLILDLFPSLSRRSCRLKGGEEFQNPLFGSLGKGLQRQAWRPAVISALLHHKLNAGNAQLGNNQFRRTQQTLLQLARRLHLSAPRQLE